MSVKERIETKLRSAFAPSHLQVIDQSHLHAGHAGAPDGGESHFKVVIVAEAFTGKTRVDRQRAINGILHEELDGPVHALALQVKSPDEVA